MSAARPPDAPDTIYYNARVLTMDRAAPLADAFAIVGDRFGAIGTNDEIQSLAGPRTWKIDARGLTILPGFVDSHNHMLGTAETALNVPLSETRSVAELLKAIAQAAAQAKPGEWVVGASDWRTTQLRERRYPTRQELDSVSPANPVYIPRGGHFAVANSAAFALAGLSAATDDPPGGHLERDPATGEPTGLLLEKPATLLVERLVPTPDETAQLGALVAMARRYAAAGITTIHEPAGTERDIAVYRRARAEGSFPTRVDLSWRQDSTLPIEQLETLLAGPPFERYAAGADLGVHTIKVVGDGSLSAGTAYLREPYPGRPTTRGMLIVQPDVLHRLAQAAYQHRWRLAVHASGDATLDYVLDAAEAAQSAEPALDRWVLLHHAQIPRQDQIERIRRLGAVVSTQSVFLWNKGADYHDWLAAQIHQTMPLRRWLQAGVPMANSSDSPSAPYPPLLGIWHSVARVDQEGQPVGQDQALTPEEALRAYTLDGAYVLRKEHDLGSITPGKLADFIALSANPLEVDTAALRSLDVLLTVIGGQPVHQREPFT